MGTSTKSRKKKKKAKKKRKGQIVSSSSDEEPATMHVVNTAAGEMPEVTVYPFLFYIFSNVI